jgi:hypothetical protein
MKAGATKEPMMKRTFVLLTGAAIALGWLAIAPNASAHGRYYGQYGY